MRRREGLVRRREVVVRRREGAARRREGRCHVYENGWRTLLSVLGTNYGGHVGLAGDSVYSTLVVGPDDKMLGVSTLVVPLRKRLKLRWYSKASVER